MDAAAQFGSAVGVLLLRRHLLRRAVRVSRHPHEHALQEVSQLDFHFSLHHAAVDAGRHLAESVRFKPRHRHVRRPADRAFRHPHAAVVVSGHVPQRDGAFAALRAVRVYPHRRHLPQHGREP